MYKGVGVFLDFFRVTLIAIFIKSGSALIFGKGGWLKAKK